MLLRLTRATVVTSVIGLSLSGSSAAQELLGDLSTAKNRAMDAGRHTLVFVTGSDWEETSKRLVRELLRSSEFLEGAGEIGELVHLDLRLYDQEEKLVERQQQVIGQLRELGLERHDMIPCVFMVDPRGVVRQSGALVGERGRDVVQLLRTMAQAQEVREMAATDPEAALQHVGRAQALLQGGEVDGAFEAVQSALEEDSACLEAWDVLSMVEARKSKGGGEAAARTAIALGVGAVDDAVGAVARQGARWQRLGLALEQQGRVPEAIYCYRAASLVDGTNQEALVRSAELCLKSKDKAGALRDALLVLRSDVTNVKAIEIRRTVLPKKLR